MAKANAGPQAVPLSFPIAGLSRIATYQSQPPYTCYDASNVRPVDTLDRRNRGGSRPGIGKVYYDLLGSGNPIRMLGSVTYVNSGGSLYDEENFEGSALGAKWATASWLSGFPILEANSYGSVSATGTEQGAVRVAFSPTISVASDYYIEMFIVPDRGAHVGEYAAWFRMNDATPVGTTAGAVARLILDGATGAYSGSLTVYVASTPTTYTFSTGNDTVAQAGWFRVKVSSNTVTCSWLGHTLVTQAISAAAGQRVGFSIKSDVAGGIALLDTFRVEYSLTGNPQPYKNLLLAVANGILYRESIGGSMVAVANTNSCNFATDRNIQMSEYQQKAYIADNGNPKALGTDGTQGSGTTKFDSATYTDWTTLSLDVNNDRLVIFNVAGGMIAGNYAFTVASGELTTTPACNAGAGTCSFRIERAPKIYDPKTDTITIWDATTGKGAVPIGCKCITVYDDTVMLAAAPVAPHLWNMSRQGNPLDWSYGDLDSQGAVAGQDTTAGQIAEPITALIPYGDDYVLIGAVNSTWVLKGHPRFSGSIHSVSRQVGPVSAQAHCKGPLGETVFLSRDGLYMMNTGQQVDIQYSARSESAQSISREKLPRELLNVDPTQYTVTLAYDPIDRGVHVYMTAEAGALQRHWWFDWAGKGFWPISLQTIHEPTALFYHPNTIAEESAVLFGCRDGYIRRYRNDFESDDATAITSYVGFGPLMVNVNGMDGILDTIKMILSSGSGPVNWAVSGADAPNDVVTTTAQATGSFSLANLNYFARPRVRGPAIYLVISNGATNRRWAMDSMVVERIARGVVVRV